MLGYVTVEKAELKMREFEVYSAYYCGICKSVGARYGQIPRLTLSYDFAFLALLLAAVDEEKDQIQAEHCIIHPIKKKNIAINNKYVDYAGDMMLILVYYNLIDDVEDENKISAVVASKIFHSNFKKLRKKYDKICRLIEKQLKELSKLEKEGCDSIDRIGETFAIIMGELFRYQVENDSNINETPKDVENRREGLYYLGKSIGKWIYLADAWDDLDEDIKNGVYNPLLYRFSYDEEKEIKSTGKGEDLESNHGGQDKTIKSNQSERLLNEEVAGFRDRIRKNVEFSMMSCLAEISKVYDLLEIKKNDGIIENIIYFGLLRKTEQLLKKGKE